MSHRWTVAFLMLATAVGAAVPAGAAPGRHALFTPRAGELPTPLRHIIAEAGKIGTRELGMNRSKLVSALSSHPDCAWIARDLLDGRVSFAMNRKEATRDGIAKVGFLNIFEAGRSSAWNDPADRLAVEAAYSGMSVKEYARTPVADRPKSGYLAPRVGSRLRREEEVQGFGGDVYIFKQDRLKDRTTWIAGDSLDQDLPLTVTGKIRRMPRLQRVLPWKDRELLLPRLLARGERPEELSIPDWSNWVDLPNGRRLRYGSAINHGYVELQYWSKLTLDDVEAFIFKGSPPSGHFLRELRRRGIGIYKTDGKRDVPWTGK